MPVTLLVILMDFVVCIWTAIPGLFHRSEGKGSVEVRDSKLPGFLFVIVWILLYGATATSICLIVHDFGATPPPIPLIWQAIVILHFVAAALGHFWLLLFFNFHAYWVSVVDIVFNFLVATTVTVLIGVEGYWVSFVLYIFYPIWLAFATWLNVDFALEHPSKEQQEHARERSRRRKPETETDELLEEKTR